MTYEVGPQNSEDHTLKAQARLHQSKFRAEVLKLNFRGSGNRLNDEDAENFANYYDGFEISKQLRTRFKTYSQKRDADMLRSEHMAFNFFAPLAHSKKYATRIINKAFGLRCREVTAIKFSYAPEPNGKYLNDSTNYDVFIQYLNGNYKLCALGIDIRYTENSFQMGKSDIKRTVDTNSIYWRVSRELGAFKEENLEQLSSDEYRQLWRAQLLGLKMTQRKDISYLTSITLYPKANTYFAPLIEKYNTFIDKSRVAVAGATFEDLFDAIGGDEEMEKWKEYLQARYILGDESAEENPEE